MTTINKILLFILFATIFFIGGMYYGTNSNLMSPDRQKLIDSLNLENDKLLTENNIINSKIDSLYDDIKDLQLKLDSIDGIIITKDSTIQELEKKKRSNSGKIQKLKPDEVALGLEDYLNGK